MAKKKRSSLPDGNSTMASVRKSKEKNSNEEEDLEVHDASEPSLSSSALHSNDVVEELPKKKKKRTHESTATTDVVDVPEVNDVVEELPKKKKKRKHESTETTDVVDVPEVDKQKAKKKQKKMKLEEEDAEAAATAVDLEGQTSAPEQIAEENTEPCEEDGTFEIFVGGVPWSFGEKTLRKDFGECGEIAKLELLKDQKTGKSRGIALITYKSDAAVKKALAYNGDDYGGRRLEVRRSVQKAKGGGKGKDKGKGKNNRELEVFIRGLGPKTKDTALEKEFAKCGEIDKVKMDIDIGDGGRCKGYAWITFKDQSGLEKALERNGTEYKEHTITVQKCGDHRPGGKAAGKAAENAGSGVEVFVRGLPLSTEESVLKDDFLECGEIASINMPKGSNGSCKGFAWITFKTQEGAEKAVAYNGDDYGGNRLLVEIAGQHKKKTGKGQASVGPKPSGCTSVVVKGLSYEAGEADLNKAFAKCGAGPVNVKVLTDWETGKSKGIAFIDFDSESAVDLAMKLSGSQIKGRMISMDYSKPRD